MPSHYYKLSCMKVVYNYTLSFYLCKYQSSSGSLASHSLCNFLTKFITHLSNLWQFIGTHDMVKCETLSPPTEKTISKYTFTAICIECFHIIIIILYTCILCVSSLRDYSYGYVVWIISGSLNYSLLFNHSTTCWSCYQLCPVSQVSLPTATPRWWQATCCSQQVLHWASCHQQWEYLTQGSRWVY